MPKIIHVRVKALLLVTPNKRSNDKKEKRRRIKKTFPLHVGVFVEHLCKFLHEREILTAILGLIE